MTDGGRSGGLHVIFSLFLGLMLSTFVGVGVYTFYGPPDRFEERIEELSREEAEIRRAHGPGQLPAEEIEEIDRLVAQRDTLRAAAREARVPWTRNTSVILIVFATLAMAVSLIRADRLPVISNGLLLGGLFTMLYGVGWIVMTDTSLVRFLVMTAALAITLGLGYLRFVRAGAGAGAGAGAVAAAGPPPTGPAAALEARIRALEERVDRAARALGSTTSARRDSAD